MNSKTITKILESIKTNEKRKANYAIIKNYKPIPFSHKNFHDITDEEYEGRTAYVDGGNAELIKSSELSIQFVRVVGLIKEKKQKTKTKKTEFYTLTQSEQQNNEIIFKTKIFAIKGEIFPDEKDLTINSMDETLKQGINRANISSIGNVARKFAEWIMTLEIANELEQGDIIIKDGNLETDFTNEKKYAAKAFEEAGNKKIIIIGLAKTSKIFCDNGNNANIELDSISTLKKWYYYPVCEKCNTMFAKLNEKSKHVFRIDFNSEENQLDKIVKKLSEESKDMIFPGYAYGLIEADKNARVSNQEKDFLKTLILSKAGKDRDKIEKIMTTENAHDILDRIG